MNWLTRNTVIIFVIVALVIGVLVNQLVYDDWRCIFAECRIVKE